MGELASLTSVDQQRRKDAAQRASADLSAAADAMLKSQGIVAVDGPPIAYVSPKLPYMTLKVAGGSCEAAAREFLLSLLEHVTLDAIVCYWRCRPEIAWQDGQYVAFARLRAVTRDD